MASDGATNQEIAQLLEQIATLLERQAANPFRVRAYRTGATTVRKATKPLADVTEEEGSDAYYRPEGKGQETEGQNTVVTETRGALVGKRVVRGREEECERYYAANNAARS